MIDTFVIDTNALISAHLLDKSESRRAYNKAIDQGILTYSFATFDEFAKTFIRSKFEKYLLLDKRLSVIKEFQARAALIEVGILLTDCRDPKDNKFLELAVSANASCIITGDKDLLALHPFRDIPILNAVDFINNF
ncbi:MAG: putative toxin-antitoxin system toxin component, PIN family [Bacteroidota bacterium]|nr:putative toxin-antitoxin system toxin component, PIN family [Bacteroidota bacterium]